jgi:hypothetical protein
LKVRLAFLRLHPQIERRTTRRRTRDIMETI